MDNALLASLLLAMAYTNAGGHYYSSTGPIQLAQVVEPEWVTVPVWPKTAPFNFSSGPIWTAVQNAAQELVEPNWIVTEAWSHYSLEPLVVNCRSLYDKLLPLGEVYVFGWVIGAGEELDPRSGEVGQFFDFADGSPRTIRCWPTFEYVPTRGQYMRVRGWLEWPGRLATDEYIVLEFKELP